MLQILHLGDCHFDDAYYLNKPERKRLLDESREEAFKAAVEAAIDRQVDLVVFAGDIFDGGRRVSLRTRTLLEQAFSALRKAGAEMAWMAGNHDPKPYMEAQGLDQLLFDYGVHVFDGKVRSVTLKARNGMAYRIVGSGHEAKGLMENRLKTYPVKVDEVVTIGMLHGSVQGSGAQGGGTQDQGQDLPPGLQPEDLYFPCVKADLTSLGYDLVCLGHVHVPYKIESISVPAFYAGSLTGLSHKETGSHGAWLHSLGHGAVNSQFLALSPLEWKTIQIAVSPELTLTQFVELVQARTEAQSGNPALNPYLAHPVNDVRGNRLGEAHDFSAVAQSPRLMLRLRISGVNDKILTALRHDPEMLRERIGNAAGAAEVEIQSDMVPERVLELQRTGDTFAAHLNACLDNPEFMEAIWTAYAQRALAFDYDQDERSSLEGTEEASAGEESMKAHLLREALHDLWPRWMQLGR